MHEVVDWAKLSSEERDILVHTKVMRQEVTPCSEVGTRETIMLLCGACGYVFPLEHITAHNEHGPDAFSIYPNHNKRVPYYSKSMSDAWPVLKRMCHEASEEVRMLFINYLDWEYAAIDRNAKRDEPIYTLLRLSTLTAEQICLCALRAEGVWVEYDF